MTNGSASAFSHDGEGFVERVIPWEQFPYGSIAIYGSCNGLLLIASGEDLFLWNPLNKYCKKVLSYFRLVDEDYRIVATGLCYDSWNDEYKAVIALAQLSPRYGAEFVRVGNFRNKSWTEVDFRYRVSTQNSVTLLNENLHWYASTDVYFLSPHCIVYFGPRMNMFNEMPMPQPKDEDGDIIFGLGALDGCLCMVCSHNRSNYEVNSVEVLTMKEYGVDESWTSMFIISNLNNLRSYSELLPLCVSSSGEVLIAKDRQIWAYNPRNNSDPIPTNLNFITAVLYEESLVKPTGYNWEEKELTGEATYVEIWPSGRRRKVKKGTRGNEFEYF